MSKLITYFNVMVFLSIQFGEPQKSTQFAV